MRSPLIRYRGSRIKTLSGTVTSLKVERRIPQTIGGRRETWSPLSIQKSLKVRFHSPTGFEWGYAGSGPAQLALAILLDFTEDKRLAEKLHQHFKTEYVATWGDAWELTGAELVAFLERY